MLSDLLRFYEMFETVNQMCGEAGIVYDLDLSKDEIEQLISLLAPLSEISKKTKVQDKAYGFLFLQKIIKERLHGYLHMERVKETRRLLIEAVDKKFFSR